MLIQSLLNKKAAIQKRSVVVGTTGSEKYTYNTVLANVACRLDESSSSKEFVGETRIVHKASHVVFMNKIPIRINTREYRILIDAVPYNILDVVDAGGAGHHLEFPVERGTANGSQVSD
jgi:hypothetical protein